MISRQLVRNFVTSAIRRSEDHGGYPGSNLPFKLGNKYKLTAIFTIFFGSGFALPYLILRHHMVK